VKPDYQEIAYRKLGLSGRGHDVGTMRYLDLPEHVLDALCIARLNYVARTLSEDEETERQDVAANYFLRYHEWLYLLKNIKSHEPGADYKGVAEDRFINRLYAGGKYEPTLAGWKKYLREATPRFYEYLGTRIPLLIPEEARAQHTYLCGATGSGKTELLKLFIHSYIVNHPNTAVIVIEPTGKLSTEVAQFTELDQTNRLVYVTYEPDKGLAPCINPLRIPGISPSDYSSRALDIKSNVADELVESIGETIRAGRDMQFYGAYGDRYSTVSARPP
jgi:hypothetical protein